MDELTKLPARVTPYIPTASLVLIASTLRTWLAGEAYRQSLAERAEGLRGLGLEFTEEDLAAGPGTIK